MATQQPPPVDTNTTTTPVVPKSEIKRGPAPVGSATPTPIIPLSKIDREPAPLPATTTPITIPLSAIDIEPTPVPVTTQPTVIPLSSIDTAPGAVTEDPSVNVEPTVAVANVSLPSETVLPPPPPPSIGVVRSGPIYLPVAQDGNVIVPRTALLNFLGNGVTVTSLNGLIANITINGDGTADLGNWAFVGNTQYNLNGGFINNSDLSHGATAMLGLPANGDGNAVEILNYYGSLSLTAGTGPGQTKNWTFGTDGVLTAPDAITTTGNITAGNVNFNNGSRVQAVTNNINLQANVDGAVELKSHGGNYTWAFDNYGWVQLPEADAAYTPVANGSVLFTPTALTLKAGFANLILDNSGNTTTGNYFLGNVQGLVGSITNLDSLNFTVENISALVGNNGVNIGAGGFNNLVVLPDEVLIQNVPLTTAGNVTANFFIGDGSQLTNIPTAPGNLIENGDSNVRIDVPNGNVDVSANTQSWTFGEDGNLTLPTNGSIIVDGGDGVIGPVSDDMVISWDNEEIRLVSVQGSIEMQADSAFRVQTNYDGGSDTYLSRWEFNQDEIVNITGSSAIVTEAGDLNLQSGRDTLSSGNVLVTAINNGVAINTWTFGLDGNLTLPSEGNIIGNTVANPGRLQWLGNSSGDGAGYTTLGLIPDDTLVGNDQYLIIDPTAPGHIHIRAGGTQDNSNADLFLGGENTYFKVSAGANNEARISANSSAWVFGADSVLTVPGEGIIRSIGDVVTLQSYDVGTGNVQSVYLGSGGGLGFFDQDIGGNWLEIFRSGAEPQIRVPVGLGNLNIQTAQGNTAYDWVFDNTGNLTTPGNISAAGNVSAGNFIGFGSNVKVVAGAYNWTFDTTGVLTAPGNITGADVVTANTFVSNAFNVVTAGNLSITSQYGLGFTGTILEDNGTLELIGSGGGGAVVGWDSTYGNGLGNIATVNFNEVGGEGILLRTGNRAATEYNWNFDNSGNLTLPGNIAGNTGGFAIGYRDIPQVSFTGNATIAAADAGKHYYSTLSTANVLTIANNSSVSWPVGTAISVVNRGTGNITVAQGSGVSLYLAGNSTSGNRLLTTYGMATLLNVAANVWMINGTGVV